MNNKLNKTDYLKIVLCTATILTSMFGATAPGMARTCEGIGAVFLPLHRRQ
jgi:hypothetical protein